MIRTSDHVPPCHAEPALPIGGMCGDATGRDFRADLKPALSAHTGYPYARYGQPVCAYCCFATSWFTVCKRTNYKTQRARIKLDSSVGNWHRCRIMATSSRRTQPRKARPVSDLTPNKQQARLNRTGSQRRSLNCQEVTKVARQAQDLQRG
jgi:hypothetical protein